MRAVRRLFPSMFHRRLLLLLAVMLLASGVLGGQVFRLTVLQGSAHRSEAEAVLSTQRLIDTVRGSIVDRKGRVLAMDAPCYDVAVDYDVITGQWAYDEARRIAYKEHRRTWGRMSFDEREALVAQYRRPFDEQVEQVWRMLAEQGGIEGAELERRKATIVQRVQAIRADVWERAVRRREMEIGGPVELAEVVVSVREEKSHHTLLSAVTDQAAYAFRKSADALPGVMVVESKTRIHPYRSVSVSLARDSLPTPMRQSSPVTISLPQVAGHLLGSMREVWAEDMDPATGRPFRHADRPLDLGGYLPGDRIGQGGAEQAAERELRGSRGRVTIRRDTGEQRRLDPVPGQTVRLTLDIALQARIEAIMQPSFGLMQVRDWHGNEGTPVGTPLNGAAVVLEVDSGQILALVSTPCPPPRIEGEPYPDLSNDRDQPLVNRALSAIYPPGSTLKPLVYTLAAGERVISWDLAIECRGHLLEDKPEALRCWGWRPAKGLFGRHGPLGPVEAIARSCNIYFYSCGRDLGPERLVTGLMRYGFGRPTENGLPEEVGGILPNLSGVNPAGRELTVYNAIQMGIGQGPIAATPLQVAAAHAALARGGYYLSPVLFADRMAQQQIHEMDLPPRVVENALRGMYESANTQHGTGAYLPGINPSREHPKGEPIINLPGVTVRAKTGTAQAPPQFDDRNDNRKLDDGEPILRDGSHSWYICHVQRDGEDRAAYIVVVLVEYGGSGGRVSGPIANQILHAMRMEGHL